MINEEYTIILSKEMVWELLNSIESIKKRKCEFDVFDYIIVQLKSENFRIEQETLRESIELRKKLIPEKDPLECLWHRDNRCYLKPYKKIKRGKLKGYSNILCKGGCMAMKKRI